MVDRYVTYWSWMGVWRNEPQIVGNGFCLTEEDAEAELKAYIEDNGEPDFITEVVRLTAERSVVEAVLAKGDA